MVLVGDDRFADARRRLLAAADRARGVAAANPAVRSYREVVLAAETQAVYAGLKSGAPAAELLPEADRACRTGDRLAADDASNPDYRARLGLAHAARGAVLARLGRPADARAAWAAADGCFPPAGGGPAGVRYHCSLSHYLAGLGQLDLGDAPAAARAARASLDAVADPLPQLRVAAARLLARAAALATGSDRTGHEDAALDQLRVAVRGGYRKATGLQTDPAFVPIRGQTEFRALFAPPPAG